MPDKPPKTKPILIRDRTRSSTGTRFKGEVEKGQYTNDSEAHRRVAGQRLEQADAIDKMIDKAVENGVPVDLVEAFPEPAEPAARLRAIGGGMGQINPEDVPRIAEGGRAQTPNTYQAEYRLKTLHRMLMRNLSIDLIAQSLGISPRHVQNLRQELQKRLRDEASRMDAYGHFGKTMAFYDEVRGLALRMASDAKVANGIRVGALNAALSAEGDKHRFLQAAGFYDFARFKPAETAEDPHQRPLTKLVDMMNFGDNIFSMGEEEAEAHAAAAAATDEDDISLF